MDMMSISAAASSLKAAADIAKTLGELKSLGDVQARVIELQSKILAAQSSALAAQSEQATLIQQLAEVEREVVRVKAWDQQKQRYKLVSPWPGGAFYALCAEHKEEEPAHWLCTSCYEGGRKSILNQFEGPRGFTKIVCPVCKSEAQSPWRGGIAPEYA